MANLIPEQREKEDFARVTKQRPVVRLCSELALVGIIQDPPDKCGGEWMMKAMKELVNLTFLRFVIMAHNLEIPKLSNDPSLSSLPLLITFLKSYSWPFLGIVPAAANKQISADVEPGSLSYNQANGDASHESLWQEEELVSQDVRERFKRMCEGYYDNVCKKLVIEHKVFLFFLF